MRITAFTFLPIADETHLKINLPPWGLEIKRLLFAGIIYSPQNSFSIWQGISRDINISWVHPRVMPMLSVGPPRWRICIALWFYSLPYPRHTLRYGATSTIHTFYPGSAEGLGAGSAVTSFVLTAQYALEHSLYVGDEFKVSTKLKCEVWASALRFSKYRTRDLLSGLIRLIIRSIVWCMLKVKYLIPIRRWAANSS